MFNSFINVIKFILNKIASFFTFSKPEVGSPQHYPRSDYPNSSTKMKVREIINKRGTKKRHKKNTPEITVMNETQGERSEPGFLGAAQNLRKRIEGQKKSRNGKMKVKAQFENHCFSLKQTSKGA